MKYQFGSTSGVGCQYGSPTIKTMWHLRYNHNIPTFVMFSDLVKAFNTSKQKLMVEILKKYGCSPKSCSEIRRMYTDNKVRLILGNIDISIPFEVGVKQGDSVGPILFVGIECFDKVRKHYKCWYIVIILKVQHCFDCGDAILTSYTRC